MTSTEQVLRVVLIGFGRMGKRHAEVYAASTKFDLVAICGRKRQRPEIESMFPYAEFCSTLADALSRHNPDLVCVSTHTDSHDKLSRMALEHDCHVFLEKPVASNVFAAEELILFAKSVGKKFVVGHIFHHDLLWAAFIEECRALSGPLKLFIRLDQHSKGDEWAIHQKILKNSTIAADCAIHYFDIMTQATGVKPISVRGTAKRTHKNKDINDNYLAATVEYSDGSIGTYESAWGPGFKGAGVTKILVEGEGGTVSIVEDTDRAVVLVGRPDGSTTEVYADSKHLERATHDQQIFVYACITQNGSLDSHHQRTLSCMAVADAVDVSIAMSTKIHLAQTNTSSLV